MLELKPKVTQNPGLWNQELKLTKLEKNSKTKTKIAS
jgi:hypothetical protein